MAAGLGFSHQEPTKTIKMSMYYCKQHSSPWQASGKDKAQANPHTDEPAELAYHEFLLCTMRCPDTDEENRRTGGR